MSCKHEFVQEEWIVEVCKNCGKLQQEIELEQQLAAANARVGELEGQVKRLHECLIFDGECIGKYQAKNKRMRELLIEIKSYAETYVDLNPRMKHIIDCAKAALEEKP